MIINGSYYGDKADIWSTGCILLELVAGHEKFCDVWMTAYDYEVLQDKEKFTEIIHETVEQLPTLLNFSSELNEFILMFLEMSQTKRPNTVQLCSNIWIKSLVEEELVQRQQQRLHTDISSKNPMQVQFAESPSQSLRNLLAVANNATDEIDADITETLEERQQFIEMIFSNLSERERKHMQEYILHHKNDGPDKHHATMHLPPIVPSTPSIGNAKKILRKGNELANQNFHTDFHSPQAKFSPAPNHMHDSSNHHHNNCSSNSMIPPFSPQVIPTRHLSGPSRSNSISPLPGLSETEEFSGDRALGGLAPHTPQTKNGSFLRSNGSGHHTNSNNSSNGSGRYSAEPKQLLFASQSERDLHDNGPLSLSSSSH